MSNQSYKGISFPFRFSPSTGGVQVASYNDGLRDYSLLRQSIIQIVLTRLMERTIEKDFGSDVPSRVFDPNDTVLQTALIYSITRALSQWEPRILINMISFPAAPDGKCYMQISYQVKRTGAQDTFATPFGGS